MAKAKKIKTKKPAAKKAVVKKTIARKLGVKKAAVKKPVAKKAAAKKIAKPIKKSAAKKPVAKKAAVKKIILKKKIAKKSPAKKVAPKKVIGTIKKTIAETIVATPPAPQGLPEQLRDAALKVLDERQADDIVTVNLAGRSAMADYVIIASGRASKQLGAIAHYLREEFAKLGATDIRTEGLNEGNWVLMDAGDVIVHLFRPEVRSYYNLEQIWTRSGRDDSNSVEDSAEAE